MTAQFFDLLFNPTQACCNMGRAVGFYDHLVTPVVAQSWGNMCFLCTCSGIRHDGAYYRLGLIGIAPVDDI